MSPLVGALEKGRVPREAAKLQQWPCSSLLSIPSSLKPKSVGKWEMDK